MNRRKLTVAAAVAIGAIAFFGGCCCKTAPEGAKLDETYTIVRAEPMSSYDAFALKDFNGLLKQALGRELPVVTADKAPKAKRIFFGIPTAEIDPATLTNQERVVTVANGDIHLFGGGVNGTRYATYDFLQNVLGYRFFDARGGVKVPDRAAFDLKPLVRRRMPSFTERSVSIAPRRDKVDGLLYLYRLGINGNEMPTYMKNAGLGTDVIALDYVMPGPSDASIDRLYLPKDDCEGRFARYTKKYGLHQKKDHPEWFGKHPDGTPNFDLQCCFSEPSLRAEFKRRMFDQLAAAPANGIVDLSAGDRSGGFCECPKCQKLVEKYGTPSGPLIDFFLEVCPEIQKRWPTKKVMTLVYRKNQTQKPPTKGLEKMPDNFVARFAPIDDDFSKDWNYKANLETYEDLKTWCRLCKSVIMWYYPNPYGEHVTPPFGNVRRLVTDMKIMHALGVRGGTFEHNIGMSDMTGFSELQRYLIMRLYDDITLDASALTKEFVDFEYGAAAPLVLKFLNELEDIREQDTKLSFRYNAKLNKYTYMTPERMIRWDADFDRMAALLANDAARAPTLRRLRLSLDLSMLSLYSRFARKKLKVIAFDDLVARIRAALEENNRIVYNGKPDGQLKTCIEAMIGRASILSKAGETPLPPELVAGIPEDRIIISIPYTHHGGGGIDSSQGGLEKDPAAAYGVAAVYDEPKDPARMLRKRLLYLYDVIAKNPRFGMGGDLTDNPHPELHRGKYRFYKLAPMTLPRTSYIAYGTDSGREFFADLSDAWVEGSHNRVEVWASVRFEGPMYYPEDAGKPNRVYCDRVVVIREKE